MTRSRRARTKIRDLVEDDRRGRTKPISVRQHEQILHTSADGKKTLDQIGAAAGVSRSTVIRVRRADRERLSEMQHEIREKFAEDVLEDQAALSKGLRDDVKNTESRTKAQSAKVLGDLSGVTTKQPLICRP